MTDIVKMYERNGTFTESFTDGDLAIKPRFGTILLTCVDARVDPAYFAGLQLGDALVLRTVGGRATDTALLEVSLLWQLMKLGAGGTDPKLGLAIIHHNDCGMAKFANPQVAAAITNVYGSDSVVETYAIADERESVIADVEAALKSRHTPTGLTISGHRYDVITGQLEQIVPPTVAT